MGMLLSNWKVLFSSVALIGYVVIQHRLYAALLKSCREFSAALDYGGVDPALDAGGFVWPQSVRKIFSQADGTWLENSPLPRDAVIDSLDNEIWRTSRYAALQRWGLAAPLIGVLLTALGFMVSPPELSGEVSDIMSKLGPLFVGVFVGALMALINQVYLHKAALELGKIRAKAVRWFDEVIWKSIRQNATNALGQATSETQQAAKYLVTSSQQLATCNISYRDSLLELNRQLAEVRNAAQTTSSTFDAFTAAFGEMTQQVRASVQNLSVLNATAAAVQNSGVVWDDAAAKVHSASATIEDASTKLHETCSNFSTNFDAVRNSMKEGIAESTGGLIAVVNNLADPLRKLEGSIQQMHENTERHSALSTALSATVEQSDRVLLERRALHADEANMQQEMAARVRTSIDSLRQLTEAVGTVSNTSEALNLAANGLKDASATISNASKGVSEIQTTLKSEVSGVTSGLQNAARELAAPIQSLAGSVARVSANTEVQGGLSERLEKMASQTERLIQERVQAGAQDSQRLAALEKQLEETARILADSAANMRQLQGGLGALVEELKEARSTRGRWRPFSWLSKSADAPEKAPLLNNSKAVDTERVNSKS